MRRHAITQRRRRILTWGALAILASGAWILAASSPAPHPVATPANGPAPGTAAMRVAIQPETGDLVPASGDLQIDALGLPKPAGDLVVRRLPDGALHADIRGHFMSYSVARISSDGRIEETCAPDAKTAQQLLRAAPLPPVANGGEEK